MQPNDCCFRLNLPDAGICLRSHIEIEPGFCDECPGYFPKAIPTPLTRAFNEMTREEQNRCVMELYSQAKKLPT